MQDPREHNRYCSRCGVEVSPQYSLCPLCNSKLLNQSPVKPYELTPREENPHQAFVEHSQLISLPFKKRVTLVGSILLGLAIPSTISLVLDILTNGSLTWSLFVVVTLGYLGFSIACFISLGNKGFFAGVVFVFISSGFFHLLNSLIGNIPWAQTIAIPILLLLSGLIGLGVLLVRALKLELFPILGIFCFLSSVFLLGTDLILVLGIEFIEKMFWSWIVLGVLGPLGTMFFLIQWYASRREGVKKFFYW